MAMGKKNIVPPKWPLQFLRWFCPEHLYEEIEGDLIQKFNRDLKNLGGRRSKQKLFWNAIRFLRPGIVLRNKFSFELIQLHMIWTYFKLAARSLVRYKMFSTINVLGLSVSMVACILILQYVRFEFSYDDFHRNAENIYRVATKVTLGNEIIVHETNTYDGISKALNTDYPEIKATTTIRGYNSDRTFIHYQDKNNKLVPLENFKAFDVDSIFFKVFSFPLLQGNSEIVLQDPYTALISETFSNNYFSGDAIGKSFQVYNGEETQYYKITGVLKDVPSNSHIKFDILTRSEPRTKNFWNKDVGFWDWGGQTYILLADLMLRVELEGKLAQLALSKNGLKNNKDDYGQISTFELQPLGDIHLFSHLQEELETNGSSSLVYALIMLAIIILIIAWVNYINLSTAMSEEKIKSIGARKVIGATRFSLILQVLTESLLFNMLSVFLAVVSVHMLLPSFASFSGVPLTYGVLYDNTMLAVLVAFVLVSAMMSGLYPAFVIASYYPVRALKGNLNTNSFTLRKILVVFQFTAAISLIITTLVAYQQLSFMRNKELGININQVMIIKAMNFDKEAWSDTEGGFTIDSTYSNKANLFKEEIRLQAGFLNATSLSHIPGQLPNWGTEFRAESIDPQKAYRLIAMGVDYDFLSTLQVKLLAGRNFSRDFLSDRGNEGKRAVLINEAAAKLLGFKTPQEAIHKHISTYWGADYEIIGVANSFHQLSVKENVQPIYFILQPRALDYFAIHYQGRNATDAIERARTTWNSYFPDIPFNYFFLDEYFDRQYQYDRKFRDIVSLFSGLTIFIGCLGLFGLTSYSILKRTKEIGIRKVMGATASNIIGLFTTDFMKLILIANAVALPLVYIGLKRWLESYAHKTTLSWWLFVVPVILVLLIGVITISLQSFKVALKNPVDSLRSE